MTVCAIYKIKDRITNIIGAYDLRLERQQELLEFHPLQESIWPSVSGIKDNRDSPLIEIIRSLYDDAASAVELSGNAGASSERQQEFERDIRCLKYYSDIPVEYHTERSLFEFDTSVCIGRWWPGVIYQLI